jgi:hypothetical protein
VTHKIEKSKEISCFEVLDVLFGGLKASLVAWPFFMKEIAIFDHKIKRKIPAPIFFQFLVIYCKPWIRIRI